MIEISIKAPFFKEDGTVKVKNSKRRFNDNDASIIIGQLARLGLPFSFMTVTALKHKNKKKRKK